MLPAGCVDIQFAYGLEKYRTAKTIPFIVFYWVELKIGGERGIRTPDYNAAKTPMTLSCKSTSYDIGVKENA